LTSKLFADEAVIYNPEFDNVYGAGFEADRRAQAHNPQWCECSTILCIFWTYITFGMARQFFSGLIFGIMIQ
jgi:hypothetical protein